MSGVNAYGGQKKTDSFRRNWDSELYDKKARDREQQSKLDEEDAERRRKGLKPRSQQTRGNGNGSDEAAAGAAAGTQAGGKSGGHDGQGAGGAGVGNGGWAAGFYCKVCDVTVKDSLTYLDHINGKNHQRMLNRSMSVARETVDDVLAKLQALRDARGASRSRAPASQAATAAGR
ncbi:hypothetical protein BX661DRAFT_169756 [Kickxella alabastrina]|uniref:uncharacterized protein n=1 Tax=Kickxella alabastrina TaxID=61397 RepID=UPI00221FB215|nr:uncharacterized protein BX661DRAFT_169756 [Kickxella alabastrina]KAI7831898.1 hypothetical protein BX661DRAFT_169756 [Kickxella alabastrina]